MILHFYICLLYDCVVQTRRAGYKEKMKKRESIHWQKTWMITIGMILLVVLASFLTISWIKHTEEKKCFEELSDEAENMADNIEKHFTYDKEQLEMLAAVIARYDNLSSAQLWKILDSYDMSGMMSRIEILLPDNTVLTKGAKKIDVEGKLSFAEEAARGEHITGREQDISEDGEYIVRNYVPITRDGSTIAMLYGIVELTNFSEELGTAPYGGKAAMYVIEGGTGDFLVDTWHDELSNIWSMGRRKMASGYDHEKLKKGLQEGRSEYVVFISQTIGRHLYFYYTPVEINDWRLAISVSEDIVFADANRFKIVLNLFMLFEGICFAIYFLWMFSHIRQDNKEKQRQMNTLNYIYDVQKILFNAHESQDKIILALEKIGQMTLAKNVGFCAVEQSGESVCFTWVMGDKEDVGAKEKELADRLLWYFRYKGSVFEAANVRDFQEKLPDYTVKNLENLTAIPVKSSDGTIYGVLASGNMASMRETATLLKNVSFSFSMFLHNMHTYAAIKERGEKDILTGLYNRNRYELDVHIVENSCENSLACIYIDLNGLHERNNEEGHEMGDWMLKRVASWIQEVFGLQYAYRLGGDEFLVFTPDMDEAAVSCKTKRVVEGLRKEYIFISVGIQWAAIPFSVDEVIKSAERKMYNTKEKYYEMDMSSRKRRM